MFTTIAQLPSLQGSSGTQVNTFSTASGQQGLSSFSLRGLGTIRTLPLLDGQRVVGANVTGVPDVSLFPQLLVKRVDIVNAGASASYGSDAVGGVVNFITDTHFKGIRRNIQGGITTYGDDATRLVQLAAGTSALGDRLHLVGSAEYDKEEGIGGGEFGTKLANGRTWFTQRTLVNRGVLNDGSPQYLVRDWAQSTTFTKYGLITAGPLQGIVFDQSGQPFQFRYGSNGVPAKNAAGTILGCFPGFCEGGDLSGNVDAGRSLKSAIDATTLNGAIVCRDALARANGCQPLNIIGGTPSAAALSYIMPEKGPYQRTRQTQDVASINISGSPVDLWAGPLSIAFGGEFRHEYYKVRADPYGAGYDATAPGGDYPNDPVLLSTGNNWYAGNYKNGRGAYSVKEAFFEANLPFLNSEKLGHANLNGAVRVTDYTTSGTVWAWKIGGTWELPIEGLRIRGAFYLDVGATFDVVKGVTLYGKIDNLFDRDPARSTIFNNPALYDQIVRVYRAGVRFKF